MSLPLTFRIQNPTLLKEKSKNEDMEIEQEEEEDFSIVVHAGVLDFTAPDQVVYVPLWVNLRDEKSCFKKRWLILF